MSSRKNAPIGVFTLPHGYVLLREINMQKDKKMALWLNLGALVIAALLVPVGLAFSPFQFSAGDGSLLQVLAPPVLILLGAVVYMVLHELVHGVFIKKYCGKKAQYGFTGLYAFAGQKDAYFSARAYLVIALSPVVVWGAVLALACFLVPAGWFWPVYFIQILNISGAVGDFYVTWLLLRMPENTYVNDDGVSMRFYGKNC